jgi:hypothetical protein
LKRCEQEKSKKKNDPKAAAKCNKMCNEMKIEKLFCALLTYDPGGEHLQFLKINLKV